MDLHLRSYSKGHIDVMIKEEIEEERCFITGSYGHPRVEEKKAS